MRQSSQQRTVSCAVYPSLSGCGFPSDSTWVASTQEPSSWDRSSPEKIEAVGRNVQRWRQGDQVFAWTGFRLCAYARYTCMPENGMLALKPVTMTYEEGAAIPLGGLNAVHFLSKGHIQSGQKVLINGAGGSIGTCAVQIARSFGADVIALDSTGKLDPARACLGQTRSLIARTKISLQTARPML